MQNTLKLTAFAIAIIFVYSCSKNIIQEGNSDTKTIIDRNNTAVGINDVERYLRLTQSESTKSTKSATIIPVVDKTRDTLMYVVNYPEGWVILSGDTRTPAEIAFNDSGNITLDNTNKSFMSWLNSAAIDMKRVKYSSDDELIFSNKEIQLNKTRWETGSPKYVDSDTTSGLRYPPLGEWVYAFSFVYAESIRSVSHLLLEQWDQDEPYNQYCPEIANSNGSHYSVGCGGVAAGAMLHHLYRKHNSPLSFHGIPMDSISVNYYSSADSLRATARYLRAINDEMGLTVLINYWEGGTFVLPGSVSNLFSNYGYDCSYASFDSDTVASELVGDKPLIVLAFDEWILNLPDITEGHYFIIDGYDLRRWVTEKHYVYQQGEGQPVPVMDDLVIYEYGATYVPWVKMNWGWASQWTNGDNDGWFSLTGNWSTNNGSFDTSRHMFYGF